ncbi:hypothetical protein ACQ4PT_013078 [Festuca glaucescens]
MRLRILVLGSLFVQYTLFVSAAVRRCALPPLLRLFIWLAYLGGDALAIYALATLFNRNKQGQQHAGSGLEVLWAPVLLIHLGGQHMMTAYSVEDNELWRRHAITVVSQVTIALYVFCKSWSGEKRLLQAAILLFVIGIIRSSHKPWCLWNASVRSMVNSVSLSTRRKEGFFVLCCEALMCAYSFCLPEARNIAREREGDEEKDKTLEEFVLEASKNLPELARDQEQAERLAASPLEQTNIFNLLVDISVPYSRRIKCLKLLMALDYQHAYRLSTYTLRLSYFWLYTKLPTIFGGGCGSCLHLALPFLTLASLILFSTNHKNHDYNATDVKVTYILFSCTTVLDFLLFLTGPCILWIAQEKVSQSNLLSFCTRKRHPTVMMKLATLVCCKDYVNMHCYTKHLPISSSLQVVELVHGYIRDGWKRYIHNAASYKSLNSRRGQWALRHLRGLRWSLDMSFDRSVLLWHIATDLCFHHQSTTTRGQECAARSRVISNYMAYLLSIRPEMLMPGTRNNIFTVACDDVELMLGLGGALPRDESGIAQEILVEAQPLVDGAHNIGALLPNACKLAKSLMELCDEGRRWEVVQGVWVEMLCYSAGRCRGYMHAKNMNEGPELLSRVWFLLSFMGMETFADRFQKLEPPGTNEEENEDKSSDDGEGRVIESGFYIPGKTHFIPTRVLISH